MGQIKDKIAKTRQRPFVKPTLLHPLDITDITQREGKIPNSLTPDLPHEVPERSTALGNPISEFLLLVIHLGIRVVHSIT